MATTSRILYRGTNGSEQRIDGGIASGALFFTPHRDVAALYGHRIEAFELDDAVRLLTEGSAEFARVCGRRRGSLLTNLRSGETLKSACDDVAAIALGAGYDAVEFTSMRDLGIAVFNRHLLRKVGQMATKLTGRRTVLFHGSASFDEIMEHGLAFDRERANDFGTGDNLASCGGTYLADCLSVAARYADNATGSEASLGGDPCAFAVEVDEGLLVADEDKVWDTIEEAIFLLSGMKVDEADGPEDSEGWADMLLSRHGDGLVARLRSDLDIDPGFSSADVEAGVRGFLLRSQCWSDWLSFGEESAAALAGIDALCSAARGPVEHGWLSQRYDVYSLTARVLDPVPADARAEAPARIVGHVRLMMSTDGLEIVGAECSGELSEEDLVVFIDAYVEAASDRGVPIEIGADVASAGWRSRQPRALGRR